MLPLNNSHLPLIIALVGPSGCGKTTLAKELQKNDILPTLVSYTTRPIRPEETEGIDHFFVTDKDMPPKESMLAYTLFGGYHYWTSLDDLYKMKEYPHIYVIDEKGILDLYDLQDDGIINLIWVQIERNNISIDNNRKERDKCRREYLNILNTRQKYPDIILQNNTTIKNTVNDFITQVTEIIKKKG